MKELLNTPRSWRISFRAVTVFLPVMRSIRHLESEKQIMSVRPKVTASKRAVLRAITSATSAEATNRRAPEDLRDLREYMLMF